MDALLSEELRRGSAADLIRARVLAGACCFMVPLALFITLALPFSAASICAAISALCYGSALVLTKRATSHILPALILCMSAVIGGVIGALLLESLPYLGSNAGFLIPPALAVYLLGPRLGFSITVAMILGVTVLFPLYVTRLGTIAPPEPAAFFWPVYFITIASHLCIWALGWIHSSSRDEAQASLEHALKTVRDSELRLSSLIASTHDLVCSLDPQGHILTSNAAFKRTYAEKFGQDPRDGQIFYAAATPERVEIWRQRFARVLAGERLNVEEEIHTSASAYTLDISLNPIIGEGGKVTGMTYFARDVTARKQAELRMGEMHRTLVDISRQAGMAEIATGVLHNVGNTLNSLNVSTSLIKDHLRESRLSGLAKATALLRERASEAGFLTQDPKGQKLPAYLSALSHKLHEEHDFMLKEMSSLSDSVDHIKSIVSMQQKYARAVGTLEQLHVPQLIDEALRLHAISFDRLGIRIERAYASVPLLLVDRHRLLQILVNLLSNARQALISSATEDKRLTLRVHPSADGQHLLIEVTDNGVGIAPEHLPRLFTQGFTTRKEGHGFGLHISALAAAEMKGRLSCTSPGLGQGATFTLELPMAGPLAADA